MKEKMVVSRLVAFLLVSVTNSLVDFANGSGHTEATHSENTRRTAQCTQASGNQVIENITRDKGTKTKRNRHPYIHSKRMSYFEQGLFNSDQDVDNSVPTQAAQCTPASGSNEAGGDITRAKDTESKQNRNVYQGSHVEPELFIRDQDVETSVPTGATQCSQASGNKVVKDITQPNDTKTKRDKHPNHKGTYSRTTSHFYSMQDVENSVPMGASQFTQASGNEVVKDITRGKDIKMKRDRYRYPERLSSRHRSYFKQGLSNRQQDVENSIPTEAAQYTSASGNKEAVGDITRAKDTKMKQNMDRYPEEILSQRMSYDEQGVFNSIPDVETSVPPGVVQHTQASWDKVVEDITPAKDMNIKRDMRRYPRSWRMSYFAQGLFNIEQDVKNSVHTEAAQYIPASGNKEAVRDITQAKDTKTKPNRDCYPEGILSHVEQRVFNSKQDAETSVPPDVVQSTQASRDKVVEDITLAKDTETDRDRRLFKSKQDVENSVQTGVIQCSQASGKKVIKYITQAKDTKTKSERNCYHKGVLIRHIPYVDQKVFNCEQDVETSVSTEDAPYTQVSGDEVVGDITQVEYTKTKQDGHDYHNGIHSERKLYLEPVFKNEPRVEPSEPPGTVQCTQASGNKVFGDTTLAMDTKTKRDRDHDPKEVNSQDTLSFEQGTSNSERNVGISMIPTEGSQRTRASWGHTHTVGNSSRAVKSTTNNNISQEGTKRIRHYPRGVNRESNRAKYFSEGKFNEE